MRPPSPPAGDWTDAFPDWMAEDRARWRRVFPNGPDYDHASGSILMIAHELALATRPDRDTPSRTRCRELADRLMRARNELDLALQRPAPVIVVAPAPRSVCLQCGSPYEIVEP